MLRQTARIGAQRKGNPARERTGRFPSIDQKSCHRTMVAAATSRSRGYESSAYGRQLLDLAHPAGFQLSRRRSFSDIPLHTASSHWRFKGERTPYFEAPCRPRSRWSAGVRSPLENPTPSGALPRSQALPKALSGMIMQMQLSRKSVRWLLADRSFLSRQGKEDANAATHSL